ncbi:hypothetical protein C8R46DRAFT_1136575 [Mycena filopes]|nr:hypothetical protein C8R46DRAFT_1136575 [Mycena filopes]
MFSFISLAALLVLSTAHASPITLTSIANLTVGTTVRIIDSRNFDFMVDPGYPLAPEFTPVNSATALATTAATAQDWILVPQDTGTFKIQSAMFPDMYISYASIGAAATIPIHSQLILRGNANAAIFSLLTLSGGTKVNIVIPAINKVLTSWTNSLTDTTSPVRSIPGSNLSRGLLLERDIQITTANTQAAAASQMFTLVVIVP